MHYLPERSTRYKTAVSDYDEVTKMVDDFLSDPDFDALHKVGITVISDYTEKSRNMKVEAFGKSIEIRTSIVFAQDLELLGEVRAVYTPDEEGKEERVLSLTWLDKFGERESPTTNAIPLKGHYPAFNLLVQAVDALLNSEECKPISPPDGTPHAWL